MSGVKDIKGKLLKVGDYVNSVHPVAYFQYDLYLSKTKNYKIEDIDILQKTVKIEGNWWNSFRFVKVDCFKNKIRKLKRLLKK